MAKLSARKYTTAYYLLILGFLMKSVGAAWDVSYHFKYFRELYQLPHILNTLGNILVLIMWWYLWRNESKAKRGPLKFVLAGILVFLFGVGFDQWWHQKFGLDLSIWSPAHITLYVGSLISVAGGLLYIKQGQRQKKISVKSQVYYVIFLVFIFEAFWFVLVQQEQGVITDYYLHQGIHTMSEDLYVAFFQTQRDIYSGIPHWIYGAWAALSMAFIFTIAHRLVRLRFPATAVAGMYVFFRFVMNTIFIIVSYPTSTVPYYVLGIAVVFDLSRFILKNSWTSKFISTSMIPLGIGAIGVIETAYPIHPPMPQETFVYAICASVIGYFLAEFFYQVLFFRYWDTSLKAHNSS